MHRINLHPLERLFVFFKPQDTALHAQPLPTLQGAGYSLFEYNVVLLTVIFLLLVQFPPAHAEVKNDLLTAVRKTKT